MTELLASHSPTTHEGHESESAEPAASQTISAPFWNAAARFIGLEDGDERESVAQEEEEALETDLETPNRLPSFMQGFRFREDESPKRSRAAYFMERDNPLPRPPLDEFNGPVWTTIQQNLHLFNV